MNIVKVCVILRVAVEILQCPSLLDDDVNFDVMFAECFVDLLIRPGSNITKLKCHLVTVYNLFWHFQISPMLKESLSQCLPTNLNLIMKFHLRYRNL